MIRPSAGESRSVTPHCTSAGELWSERTAVHPGATSASMWRMDTNLHQRLRDAAERAFAGSPVLFAYLFGSVASGRNRPDSDIDVGVCLEPSVDTDQFLDLRLSLAGRLAAESGLGDIDLLILNEAPLPLLGRAIRERLVLYSRDEPARVRFESRGLREFFDFEIHARPLDRQFLQDIAEGRR